MKYFLICILAFNTTCSAVAQSIGRIDHRPAHNWVKVDGHFLISWYRGAATDSSSSEIDIFDKHGQPVSAFDVLRLVPDAKTVWIGDVALHPPDMIAVAAVYDKGDGTPFADALLYLNFKGQLRMALALDPSLDINALSIDENLNVWTITTQSYGKDPSQAPMVVVYDKNGKVKSEPIRRNTFPMHAISTKENPAIGSMASGYESGVFWFWLPGSTDLITIKTLDGVVTKMQTGMPLPIGGRTMVPLQIAREASGIVIVEVREERTNEKARLAHYSWSPETKLWTPFNPEVCEHHRLVGIDNAEQIYVKPDATSDICTSSR